ncbi:MAG: DUF4097 domain-containing protein [Lachnospiraceae bacterium]|nr:DUF4097 domain-containing protein [Lachnospiraceae bacterium]
MEHKHPFAKIFIIVLGLITIAAMVYGMIVHLGVPFFRFNASTETTENTVSLDSFHSLDLDLDAGSVTLVEGDGYFVKYKYPANSLPTIEVKGDQLVVKEKIDPHIHLTNKHLYEMVITVPAGTAIKDSTIHVDMGEFIAKGFTFDDLNIDADMGSIELTKVTFQDGYMDADMGNIQLKDCTFDTLEAVADMGNLEISGTFSSVTGNCAMGNIEIDTTSTATFDLRCDLGNITVNGDDKGTKYKN